MDGILTASLMRSRLQGGADGPARRRGIPRLDGNDQEKNASMFFCRKERLIEEPCGRRKTIRNRSFLR